MHACMLVSTSNDFILKYSNRTSDVRHAFTDIFVFCSQIHYVCILINFSFNSNCFVSATVLHLWRSFVCFFVCELHDRHIAKTNFESFGAVDGSKWSKNPQHSEDLDDAHRFTSVSFKTHTHTHAHTQPAQSIRFYDNNVELASHPRPTQPSITPGSVNEYQLRLGRQRQVWFIPLADERGVCR